MNKKIVWAAVICLLVGTALLFYYPVQEYFFTAEQKKEIAGYRQGLQDGSHDRPNSSGDASEGEQERLYTELYQEILAYNRAIYEDGQAGLKDAWSYEQPAFTLGHYGLPSDIFGVLTIPAMDLELPIYLGAFPENLARGATILGQTSLPVGQENTNCVIAAHRGFRGRPMFRDIESLKVGDRIFLENPWGVQTWEVSEITVILPQDIDAIRIREGQTMLTLLTCHPYGKNHHRYVVYCRQVGDGKETGQTEGSDHEAGDTEGKTGEESQVRTPDEVRGSVQRLLERVILPVSVPLILWAVVLLLRGKKGR